MAAYVVAGATGRVGSVVLQRLLEGGHAVTAITRAPDRGDSLRTKGASIAVQTLADEDGLIALLSGATGFFVLLPEPVDAADFHAERRVVAQAIARAITVSDIGHVVALSSLGAHHAERMGPITDLHHFENALRATGKPLTVLRAATFQDNVAALVDPAMHAGIFPNLQPDRDTAISMVATRDVGEVAARILTYPAQEGVVDVLGPWYSPRQVAGILGSAIGRILDIVDIPPAGHVAALCQSGIPQSFAEILAELQEAIASRRIESVGDRREIGPTTLAETLAIALRPAATAGES